MQLFSVDQQRSQALEAHAASFATFKVKWSSFGRKSLRLIRCEEMRLLAIACLLSAGSAVMIFLRCSLSDPGSRQ